MNWQQTAEKEENSLDPLRTPAQEILCKKSNRKRKNEGHWGRNH